MGLVFGSHEKRRCRTRYVASLDAAAWRWTGVDAGPIRSGHASLYRWNRQPIACLHRRYRAKGLNEKVQRARNPAKVYDVAGAPVPPANGGTTNWQPHTFSPDAGLFCVPQHDICAMYYLTETDPRGAMGLDRKDEQLLAEVAPDS